MDTAIDTGVRVSDFVNILVREAEKQRDGKDYLSVEELIDCHIDSLHRVAKVLQARGLAPPPVAPTEQPNTSTDPDYNAPAQPPVYTNNIQRLTDVHFTHNQLNKIKQHLQHTGAYSPIKYPQLHKLSLLNTPILKEYVSIPAARRPSLLPTPTHTVWQGRIPDIGRPPRQPTPTHTAWRDKLPDSVRLPPPSKFLQRLSHPTRQELTLGHNIQPPPPILSIATHTATQGGTTSAGSLPPPSVSIAPTHSRHSFSINTNTTHHRTLNTHTNTRTEQRSTNPQFTALVSHINSLLRLLHNTLSWETGIPTRLRSSINTFISSIHPPAPTPLLQQQLNLHSDTFLREVSLSVTSHNKNTYTRLLAELSALDRQDYALAESVVTRQLKRSHPHLTHNTITQFLNTIRTSLSNSSHTLTHSPTHTPASTPTHSSTLVRTNSDNNTTNYITHITPTPSKRRLSPSPKPQRTPKVAKRSILRQRSESISPVDNELVQVLASMVASPDSLLAEIEKTYDHIYDPTLGCITIRDVEPADLPHIPSLDDTIVSSDPRMPSAENSPTCTETVPTAPVQALDFASAIPPAVIHTFSFEQSHSWKLRPRLHEHNILVIADSNGTTWTAAPPNWCIYSFSGLRFHHIDNILRSANDLGNYERILIHVGINDVYNYGYAVKHSLPAFISLLNTSKLPLLYIPHPQNPNTLQSIQTKIQYLITAPIEQCENRVINPVNITYISKNDKTNKHYSITTATDYITLILHLLN
jgi:hypothetical protein